MSWVHCNRCFFEPGNSKSQERAFFLTSCGHITCQKCHEASPNVCSTCKKGGIKALKVDSSMNKQYRQYFVDVSQIIISKLEEMGKIRKFQDTQIHNLVKGTLKLQEMVKKYQEMLKKYEGNRGPPPPRSMTDVPAASRVNGLNPEFRVTHNAEQQQPTRSRSSNASSKFVERNISHPTLRGSQSEQRTRSRSSNASSKFSEHKIPHPTLRGSQSEPRSRTSNVSSRFDGNIIPPPDFRVTFNAQQQQQRTRSKSPAGCMQGTIKKGPIVLH